MLIADILLTLVFIPLMIFLFSKRLDELEDWQKETDERLSRVEVKTKVEGYEVGYLLEQAEKK
ncbi:MAG: hypothetical protein IJS39_00605 [Synergistaceae bacterium]|nr:hypothetical protein [Synergistaceae bacterium]